MPPRMDRGYELLAPTPERLEDVAAVVAAGDVDDSGEVTIDAGFLREEWSYAGFTLATDAWVAVDRAGRVVAYGQVNHDQPGVIDSWGVVHPEHQGRGIGTRLLERIEERAREMAGPSFRFRHAINAGDHAAAGLLEARGLGLVRHFWHMQIDLDGPTDPGPAPEGIEIAPLGPDADLAVIHAVLDEAFTDHWQPHTEPLERWVEQQRASPSFDPSLWLLASAGGEPVGALTASLWDGRGWVRDLGVLASARRRGIGEALLRHSFAALAGRGAGPVILNVDAESLTRATALYERVGMRVVKRWDLWERPQPG